MDKVMDLIALVADADMEAAVRALLSRPSALGIRSITFDVKRHIQRDAGCLRRRTISSACGWMRFDARLFCLIMRAVDGSRKDAMQWRSRLRKGLKPTVGEAAARPQRPVRRSSSTPVPLRR